MACEITITSVSASGSPGQPVTLVDVRGTATDCDSVVVQVGCGGPEEKQQVVGSPHPGNPQLWTWKAIFSDLAGTGCACDDPNVGLTALAYCKADPACSDRAVLRPIPCKPPDYCCPAISVKHTVGGCDAEGRRQVTFEVYVTPAADPTCPETVFAQLDFGDGALGQGFAVPPNAVWTETHAYVPGSYTARLHVIVPSGCKDFELTVGPLPQCDRGGGDGGGDGRPCPWWNPACWHWCGLFGSLLAIVIGAYIVGIATGWGADDPSEYLTWLALLGIEITADVLTGVIGGVIAAAMAAYLAYCGACNLAKAMIAGGTLGIVVIIAITIYTGSPPPNWIGAVITALFIIAAGWVLYDKECD